MKKLIENSEDMDLKAKVWATTEAELLELAFDLSAAKEEPDREVEPRLFSDMEPRLQPSEAPVLARIKAKGYPLSVVRGISDAVRPKTIERRLEAYRWKLGL